MEINLKISFKDHGRSSICLKTIQVKQSGNALSQELIGDHIST